MEAEQVRTKVLAALLSQLRSRPDAFRLLVDAAWSEFQRMSLRAARKLQGIETRIAERIRDRERLTTLLIKLADSESLLERLTLSPEDGGEGTGERPPMTDAPG